MKLPTHPNINSENQYQKRKALISKVSPPKGKTTSNGQYQKVVKQNYKLQYKILNDDLIHLKYSAIFRKRLEI